MTPITNGHTVIPANETLPFAGRADSAIGLAAAHAFVQDPASHPAKPRIFDEFKLKGRVAFVTGGNRGLGLEMALAMAEQGATVYCCDLGKEPSEDFEVAKAYAKAMGSRIEYAQADVTDQPGVRMLVKEIAEKEGTLDICVAAAGILGGSTCLDYPIEEFQKIMNVNTNGVFIASSACAGEMARLKVPGSIILIASMSGSITNRDNNWIAYNTSKSAVLQMARSMACELGPLGIRVNTVSPGHIRTSMTAVFLDKNPELEGRWSSLNPLGRIGKVHEIRGVVAWLASDASTFCTGSDILVSGGHHAW